MNSEQILGELDGLFAMHDMERVEAFLIEKINEELGKIELNEDK